MPNSTTKLNKIFFISAIFLFAFLNTNTVSAAVLTPGNISTCGELALPGTYTLTGNVSGGSDTCFDISSNGVTIDGADFSITGSSSSTPAIDARARIAGPGSSLTNGGNAYTNLLITALSISGYETGLNISGNDSTSGFAGDAGATEIFYSNIGDIVANGGTAGAETYGGTGGSISITDINLNISNTTFSTLAGSGTVGFNTDGGVVLNYTEAITTMGSLFSKMNFFNENDTSYGIYPGGTFPIQPGNIDSCGTLHGPGTFTVTQDISDITDTCFYIASDDVVIDGGDYSIELLDASSTSYAIDAEYGDFDNLTINSLNFSNYQNIINSTQSVIINSDSDIDLSNGSINALIDLTINAFANLNIASSTIDTDSLNINSRGTFSYASTTASALSSLIVNGEDYGDNFTGGDLSEFAKNAGDIWAPSTDSDVDTNRNWWSITSSADGTKLAAVVYYGLIYTLNTDRDTISYTVSGPASGGNYSSWNPSVDWGLAENCYASYDNFATTTVTLDCELNGSDIPLPPSGGENTIHLMATHPDFISQIQSVTFTYDTTTSPIILSIDIIIPNDQSSISEFNPMVSWSSSETCSYSYDGSTYTTVDCANSGSDISAPSSTGTSTLYVKGVDSNSVEDIASSTFSLTGFYFCGTSDNDWNNDLNWYSDAGCSATTTAPVSQYSVAVAVGTTSPVVSSSTDPIPNNINTTLLTGSAEQAGVIFSDNVSYSGMLVGNATFNDSSYNTGTVTGDAILNTDHYGSTQTGGVFTVGTGKTYSGEIQGTVYDSESNTITNYVFEGSSQNEGIVNIDATFNNTSEFQVGTVNATATLNGENQIIKGVNSVINFFKQLTDGATSLFFKPNTIFNVSGLFTLLGDDSNNLLTVRSTTPGSSYNLGINGTSNFNFLKLKDAVNTSSLLDLSSKTVQDDGGNSGFTFPANSQTGSRSFSSTNNSTPSIPVSRGGTDSSAVATSGDGTGTSSSNSGIVGIRNSIQQLSPIQFTPTQQFTPFGGLGEDFVPQNSGGTTIPDPFANFQAPSQLDFIQLPSNFSLIISNFLFAQIPQSIQDTLNSIPKIANLVASISGANGSSQSAQIAKLQTNPVAIENIDGDIGVFVIENEEGNNIRTHLTYYDGQLAQLVKINIDKDIKVKLNPLAEGQIFAEYLGVNIPFLNNNEGIPQIELKTPSSRGEYLFSTKATLLPLVIEVIEPQIIEVKTQRRGFIPWLIELIFDRW